MGLQDVAATVTDGGLPWRTCATCHALDTMPDADAAVLRSLLADRRVKFTDLAKALAADEEAPTIPHDALSRHARGLCSAREVLR